MWLKRTRNKILIHTLRYNEALCRVDELDLGTQKTKTIHNRDSMVTFFTKTYALLRWLVGFPHSLNTSSPQCESARERESVQH